MGQLWEYIKIALMNIRSNKGRSLLTMLGIIIGISSVILIISVGNGIKSEINGELNQMAGGQVVIYANNQSGMEPVYFTEEDFQAVQEEVDHVKGVTDVYTIYATVSTRKGNANMYISCGTPAMEYYSSEPIIRGRYFSQNEYEASRMVCVIPENAARQMFGNTDVVGMSVEADIYGITQEFTIVGVREDSAASLVNAMNGNTMTMEIPLHSIENFGFYFTESESFYIMGEGNEYASQIARDAVRLMERRHKVQGKGVIMVESFSDALDQVNSVLNYVTAFVVLVAAISLLVGGIGVMNIMLVSVTERTREIGIRKSLGARTSSILIQFLSESAIITLLGGVIGITLGVLGAWGVCSLIGFSARVQLSTVLGASLFSSAVGIFFGIYPARKAARMSPIDALRHE